MSRVRIQVKDDGENWRSVEFENVISCNVGDQGCLQVVLGGDEPCEFLYPHTFWAGLALNKDSRQCSRSKSNL